MKNMIEMYTKQKNSKHFLNGERWIAKKEKEINGELKSGSKDMSGEENQTIKPLKYNMKKFEAITKNTKEFLFAPSKEQAERMFFQLYGYHTTINEVEKTIY